MFKVELTVFGDLEQVSITTPYDRLVIDDASSDLTVMVGPDTIRVHRSMLATRSEVFNSCKGELIMDDFDMVVIRALFNYMYTDLFPDTAFMKSFAADLLAVSIKYQVAGTQQFCEDYFCRGLDKNNVESILQMADSVGAIDLKTRAMCFNKEVN